MPRINSTVELDDLRKQIVSRRNTSKPCISICGGTGCHNHSNNNIATAFHSELTKKQLQSKVDVKVTGCHGFCEHGPIIVIYPEQICYVKVSANDVTEIIEETIVGKRVIDRLTYSDSNTGVKAIHETDIPFYKNQMRIVINDHNKINPTSIEDYLAIGGFSALTKVLQTMSPDQVIAEVKKSNIRGRSGNGFAVGRKWEACAKAEGDTKYLICNCHEGDPGAFVDRRIMEANPYNIIEGMLIGAYAIKATDGFIFVGDEYPLTVQNTEKAIQQAEDYGLLGKNILNSGLNFTIKIVIDGGNYVCGESTALTASMEGRIGEPITKYDHATERGLWAKPTDLNNLQSWANIPFIINMGAESYLKIGKEKSQGTRVFSLSGVIKNSGIVEVPMGMPFKKIVYDIGGGTKDDNKIKAIEVGGPMGGFIPESLLDMTVDFDELTKAGLTLGPGLVILSENTCIVDTVKYFISFLANESCGKCLPCREGLRQMLQILDRIVKGKGQESDLELLNTISEVQKTAALCALGQGASNTLTSCLKHFREEFMTHIDKKQCPSGTCKELIALSKV